MEMELQKLMPLGQNFMNETAEEIRTVGRVDIRYLGECALGCPGESLRCS